MPRLNSAGTVIEDYPGAVNGQKRLNAAGTLVEDYGFRQKGSGAPTLNSAGNWVEGFGPSDGGAPLLNPPTNLTLPTITGTAQVGQTLTGTTGTWTGTPTSYNRQWRRNGAVIVGATSANYILVTADLAANITYEVVAVNPDGSSAPAVSLPTAAVAEAPPVGQVQFTSQNNSGTWTVPPGVISISVVVISRGGDAQISGSENFAGGGGALAYSNNQTVTPGETLNWYTPSAPAATVRLTRVGTNIAAATNGSGYFNAGSVVAGLGHPGGRGDGGYGYFENLTGGGAGGYTSAGGNSASGGGSGGGGSSLLGGGAGAASGASGAIHGAAYGGGGATNNGGGTGTGGPCGIRIIWGLVGGQPRAFPNTNTADVLSPEDRFKAHIATLATSGAKSGTWQFPANEPYGTNERRYTVSNLTNDRALLYGQAWGGYTSGNLNGIITHCLPSEEVWEDQRNNNRTVYMRLIYYADSYSAKVGTTRNGLQSSSINEGFHGDGLALEIIYWFNGAAWKSMPSAQSGPVPYTVP